MNKKCSVYYKKKNTSLKQVEALRGCFQFPGCVWVLWKLEILVIKQIPNTNNGIIAII